MRTVVVVKKSFICSINGQFNGQLTLCQRQMFSIVCVCSVKWTFSGAFFSAIFFVNHMNLPQFSAEIWDGEAKIINPIFIALTESSQRTISMALQTCTSARIIYPLILANKFTSDFPEVFRQISFSHHLISPFFSEQNLLIKLANLSRFLFKIFMNELF